MHSAWSDKNWQVGFSSPQNFSCDGGEVGGSSPSVSRLETFKSSLATTGNVVLWVLAVVALCLSVLPLLLGYVLALGLSVALIAAGIAYRRQSLQRPVPPREFLTDLARRRGKPGEDVRADRYALRAHRTLRLAALAILLNCALYLLLAIHSWGFYIWSLDRELEPLRGAFRTIGSMKPAPRDPKRPVKKPAKKVVPDAAPKVAPKQSQPAAKSKAP